MALNQTLNLVEGVLSNRSIKDLLSLWYFFELCAAHPQFQYLTPIMSGRVITDVSLQPFADVQKLFLNYYAVIRRLNMRQQ
jgi:hypothetical protein